MNFLLLLMVFEKIELVLPAKTYAAPCIRAHAQEVSDKSDKD